VVASTIHYVAGRWQVPKVHTRPRRQPICLITAPNCCGPHRPPTPDGELPPPPPPPAPAVVRQAPLLQRGREFGHSLSALQRNSSHRCPNQPCRHTRSAVQRLGAHVGRQCGPKKPCTHTWPVGQGLAEQAFSNARPSRAAGKTRNIPTMRPIITRTFCAMARAPIELSNAGSLARRAFPARTACEGQERGRTVRNSPSLNQSK
jgi:hypothetical protein